MSSNIKDYRSSLSKAGNDASLFMDWAGNDYVGVRGKADDTPTSILNTATGEAVEGIKEIEGKQIIEEMKTILPTLLAFNGDMPAPALRSASADDEKQKKYDDLLNALQNQSVDAVIDAMLVALLQDQNETEAYWNFMTEFIPQIEQLDENEIISDAGKGLFSRIVSAIRRIFSGVDETKYKLDRYVNSGAYRSGIIGDWCGPWACGYILYTKTRQDKYSTFESCASTVGELSVGNFALRLLGRPMTPLEMAWSMPIVSEGKIWIDPDLRFVDYAAYDQIRYNGKPALRLCSSGSSLHWTVAYGTYQTGSYLWRTYYYLQQDNGSKGTYKNPASNDNYSQVDWWNPWLLIWD